MKIAIVHDELLRQGGAEQVTILMHKAFPDAPIYTTCYNAKSTYPEFRNCEIHASWLNRVIRSEKNLKRFFFPFSFWAMRSLNLKAYDVILMSTTTFGKFIKPNKDALVISFTHYPFRLVWFPESYSKIRELKGIKRWVFNQLVSILKKMDFNAAQRINFHLTNTPRIKKIIENCYKPNSSPTVIPASIVCSNFYVESTPKEDYYLVVSRIESYKKVDLVIEAFNKLLDRKLIIVGRGSEKDHCIKVSSKNIEFKEGVSKEEIAWLYANCKALIFPQEEDYGLTPIEANASGRPVIAFGKGGVLNTTIPYLGNSKTCTAIYFEKQEVRDLIDAIQLCESLTFDSKFIRRHAEQFDEEIFIKKIRDFVHDKYRLMSKDKLPKMEV